MIIKKLPWEVFVNNLTFRILIVYIKYELAISLTIFTCEIAIKIIVNQNHPSNGWFALGL